MKRDEYTRQLKRLIRKFHPDLCKDEYLEAAYNEITIKLNAALNRTRIKAPEPENDKDQGYECYKSGIKHYKNIHPDRFFRRKSDSTYESISYEEQLKTLNRIYISFNSAEYYFTRVIEEFPNSPWANDAREKITLLGKLHRSYTAINTETHTRIIDNGKFVKEMGLRIL